MIIVEGLDNTGKTTLCQRIAEDFPQLQYNPSPGNKHDLPLMLTQAWEQSEDRPNELWDRCRFISEYVYNPILKARPLLFDPTEWLNIMGRYIKHRQLLIYCNMETEHIKEGFDEREQLEGVAQNLTALHNSYDMLMYLIALLFNTAGNGSVLMDYDYRFDSYEDYIKPQVDQYLKEVGLS